MSVAKKTIQLIKDKQFTEAFILNQKLAFKIAHKYVGGAKKQPVYLDDLKQESLMALWKAVTTFKYKKGFYFSTYATKVITNALNDVTNGKVPRHRPVTNKPYIDLNEYENVIADKVLNINNRILFTKIVEKLNILDKKEKKILIMHSQGFDNVEIGKKYKFSGERARQYRVRAINKLKTELGV